MRGPAVECTAGGEHEPGRQARRTDDTHLRHVLYYTNVIELALYLGAAYWDDTQQAGSLHMVSEGGGDYYAVLPVGGAAATLLDHHGVETVHLVGGANGERGALVHGVNADVQHGAAGDAVTRLAACFFH